MRMRNDIEAYIDDYDKIHVYYRKGFFGGKSRVYHLKDSQDRIINLSLTGTDSSRKDYNVYTLSIDSPLEIGEEYTLFDEHCQSVPAVYSHIVKTSRFSDENRYEKDDLGLTYAPQVSAFRVWSPVAHEIRLNLYKESGVETIQMVRREKGMWEAVVREDLLHVPYTYMVRVNGEWKETVDPYNPFIGLNNTRSIVDDFSLLDLPEKIKLPAQNSHTDAIIYEASIRDMTSWAGCGVSEPRTFAGFVEENEITKTRLTGFSYLKTLGITHVQLMPVFKIGSVDEKYPHIYYNWGYDPMHYRALEGSYSLDPEDPRSRVEEFTSLVETLHANGMKVNLDLVFNHVYNKGRFALEKLVPDYYFLMNDMGGYSNGSFCGNDVDTRPYMSRKYFLDTCRMIVENYNVDGFRFDLMGILDFDLVNTIVKEMRKIKPDFMVYGEGWNMGSFVPEDLRASMQNHGKMPEVGFFSDRFRDVMRGGNDGRSKGYISGNTGRIYEAANCMKAGVSEGTFSSPVQALNYVECHDNMTLWDTNRATCAGESSETREKRQILANAMVLCAQGIPFLHAGQEFGRTKQNLDNTYNRSDTYNRMDYFRRNHHQTIVDATKRLIEIRKEHPALHTSTKEELEQAVSTETVDGQMLVYRARKGSDSLICFFNPTDHFYDYNLPEEGTVLFDSGNCCPLRTSRVVIAPISAVIVQLPA